MLFGVPDEVVLSAVPDVLFVLSLPNVLILSGVLFFVPDVVILSDVPDVLLWITCFHPFSGCVQFVSVSSGGRWSIERSLQALRLSFRVNFTEL